MSRSKPKPGEVEAFDKLIQEGQEFANTYNAYGDGIERGQRRIRLTDKKVGHIVEYVTTAHPNPKVVGRVSLMTTTNLYRKFKKIGD